MVSLMDQLLKSENLDLCLTPYKVLATGQDEGMLEFIPSRSLAQVSHCSQTALTVFPIEVELGGFLIIGNTERISLSSGKDDENPD